MQKLPILLWGAMVAAGLCPSLSFAQFGPESFETYDAGSFIVGQGGWRSWNDVASGPDEVDAVVVSDAAKDGTQSLQVNLDTDIVQAFDGTYTSGIWTVSTWVHIPATLSDGQVFFILLNRYESGATAPKDWSTQIFFDVATQRIVSDGGTGFDMPGERSYTPDVWNFLQVVVDLDSNQQQVFFNNELLASGPWHNSNLHSVNELECVNLYSGGAETGYFDIVEIQPGYQCGQCCPPAALTCVADSAQNEVALSWSNLGTTYADGITVLRNGAAIASLPGDAESYLDASVPDGGHRYTISGDCGAFFPFDATASCFACVANLPPGTTDYIWVAGGGKSAASAEAIADELENAGRTPFVCDALALPDPAEATDIKGLWILLGIFPNNHALTSSEAQTIVDWVTPDVSRSFYIESGDAWGFDSPTVLNAIDGTRALSDGSFSCAVTELSGRNSGIPSGLDLQGIAGAYSGDCHYIDHLTPDFAGSAGPIFANANQLGHLTGIFHNGLLDGTGLHRNVASSTQFGGFEGDRTLLMQRYLNALFPQGGETLFLRGDADGNGEFNALVDALRILGFAFIPGTPAPPCRASADADGDLVFNGLVDGLRVLNFGFVPGADRIPPPYPECGTDQGSLDEFGCKFPCP